MATDFDSAGGAQPWPSHLEDPPLEDPPLADAPLAEPPLAEPPLAEPALAEPPLAEPPLADAPLAEPADPSAPAGLPVAQPSAPQPTAPQPPTRPSRVRLLALTVVGLGLLGVVGSAAGAAVQLLPRHFSASQRAQIANWEYGKRWRTVPAGKIFPAKVSYAPPAALDDDRGLKLGAHRVGLAAQATCAAATDPAAAAVLNRDGCTAVLRATYVDQAGSYVVTVGAAVLPGTAQATAAARELSGDLGSNGRGPTVLPVPFKGTPAAWFTAKRRQLSGVTSAGSYVVMYTVGYTDTRPAEPVTRDTYTDNEMTSAGLGVAQAVLSVLAAPVPAAHCPGTPGC